MLLAACKSLLYLTVESTDSWGNALSLDYSPVKYRPKLSAKLVSIVTPHLFNATLDSGICQKALEGSEYVLLGNEKVYLRVTREIIPRHLSIALTFPRSY